MTTNNSTVINKRVVSRKIRLTRRFSLFRLLNNKINKRMEYLAAWQADIWSTASGCFDLVWQCCQVTLSATTDDSTAPVTSDCPIYLFPTSNTGSKKHYLWEKNDWLKNRRFFITENFLEILNRVCAEPMCRSHDFLSLTQAIVVLKSGRCYFLQQCQCLSVCVLCVLVVRCVKS